MGWEGLTDGLGVLILVSWGCCPSVVVGVALATLEEVSGKRRPPPLPVVVGSPMKAKGLAEDTKVSEKSVMVVGASAAVELPSLPAASGLASTNAQRACVDSRTTIWMLVLFYPNWDIKRNVPAASVPQASTTFGEA